MICAKCGGEVLVNEKCDKCGIEYSEMIEGIRHDELLKLLEKIEEMLSNHQSIELEESLLACELANSHFLVPAEARDNGIVVGASVATVGSAEAQPVRSNAARIRQRNFMFSPLSCHIITTFSDLSNKKTPQRAKNHIKMK